jgi:hypothetical protein
MARDRGLEELLNQRLERVNGLTQKAMFGGWAYLVHGNLLCGSRVGSMLVRVGKDQESWALEIPGVSSIEISGRVMKGWVRATPEVYGNDEHREKLLDAALAFNQTLPKK